jgi:hypothetical protein
MPTISQTQLDTIAALLPDEHLTLAEIATLAGVSRETVLAVMDGNVAAGSLMVPSSPAVTPLAKPIATTSSCADNSLGAWRREPLRSFVSQSRPAGPVKVVAQVGHSPAPRRRRSRLRKPRYLPTRAEIRQACLQLHERGRPRAEDRERPAYELPVASAGLFEDLTEYR